MQIPFYHVDTFTNKLFSGNPAAVCILPEWLPEALLKKIASENNLPATAFLVRNISEIQTRWFSPEYEIDLCGHGTIASAQVIFTEIEPDLKQAQLYHPVVGVLRIKRQDELITLDFPCKQFAEISLPDLLAEGLGQRPEEIYQYQLERLLAVFATEEQIRNIEPNRSLLKQLNHRGIIITAPGKKADFVSRVFYPFKTLFEDAVTGSSYCLLAPYWSQRLGKTKFRAHQLSHRGGEVFCEHLSERILVSGTAILYSKGVINLEMDEFKHL